MNHKKNINAFLILCATVSILVLPAISGAKAKKTESKSAIQIEANHMMSDKKQNSVFFSGKVVAKQDDVLIHADEMTVYYNQAKDAGQGKVATERSINRLRAVGNVEITKDDWVATGDNAEYIETERKVILTGNTKVWQNNSMVTGDKFILYLDEGKSIVESGTKKNGRVKAFFYPNSDN